MTSHHRESQSRTRGGYSATVKIRYRKQCPQNMSLGISMKLLPYREDPLLHGVHKSVPRDLDDDVTPSRGSDTTEHPRTPRLGMLLRLSSCPISLTPLYVLSYVYAEGVVSRFHQLGHACRRTPGGRAGCACTRACHFFCRVTLSESCTRLPKLRLLSLGHPDACRPG